MEKQRLLSALEKYGYSLMRAQDDPGVNETLAGVVESGDPRLWEGFPLVLASGLERGSFDFENVLRLLSTEENRAVLKRLVFVSAGLFKLSGLKADWCVSLRSLPGMEGLSWQEMMHDLRNDGHDVFKTGLSASRLRQTFQNYFSQQREEYSDLLSVKEGFQLEFALSQVFSPKQKELFLKKVKRQPLTKTEREYFSRVVKKKAQALATSELHRLAKAVLEG